MLHVGNIGSGRARWLVRSSLLDALGRSRDDLMRGFKLKMDFISSRLAFGLVWFGFGQGWVKRVFFFFQHAKKGEDGREALTIVTAVCLQLVICIAPTGAHGSGVWLPDSSKIFLARWLVSWSVCGVEGERGRGRAVVFCVSVDARVLEY